MSGGQTRELKPVDADEVKRLIEAAIVEYDAILLARAHDFMDSFKRMMEGNGG